MNEYVNIISSEITHIGRFDIVMDTIEKDGNRLPYSYVKMHKGVGVIGLVDDKVILLKQYRYIWDKWIWEIPGGMVDEGEEPENAAIREIEEETGYSVRNILFLGICYPSVGSSTELQYLYFAECEGQREQALDPLERIKVELIQISEFEKMIQNGDFSHGMGLAAWLRYKMKFENAI